VGSSSIGNQTTPAVGRHFGSDPTRSSERYESDAASATSLNQALPGVWTTRKDFVVDDAEQFGTLRRDDVAGTLGVGRVTQETRS